VREGIYFKLSLLARIVDHMGSDNHHWEFESDDYFGMYLLLSDIAQEVYPEWQERNANEEPGKE
jgi:hypothetical protein